MGFDTFLAPLHRNKLTIGNAMVATPRAAQMPIVDPLLELDILASGAHKILSGKGLGIHHLRKSLGTC